ncbi:MAG TPA: S1C family serine protease [Alphaproteobacteria bacterium]|jgi:S1-C subfamily serine protease
MRAAFAFRPAGLMIGALFAAAVLAGVPQALAAQDAEKLTPERIAQSVVQIHVDVPADAPSAHRLGATRDGIGAVIRMDGIAEGHIVTIGYLIMDAGFAEVTDYAGHKRAAQVVGYDQGSGLGLLRLSGKADLPALELGDSRGLELRHPVIVASSGQVGDLQPALVASLRPFAASWEYMLERAIYATPAVPQFGGAPLLGSDGKLVGVGSLLVNDAVLGQNMLGNMFVPAELLRPVVRELVESGRPKSSHPWLGLNAEELQKDGMLIVGNVTANGPAAKAGLRRGDVIYSLDGQPIKGLADFYTRMWGLGGPGVEVPLRVMQPDGSRQLRVKSDDRYRYMKSQATY